MGDVERVMERVHRLLAIANDPAASDNEQRIALEQAQRLMNKHAIEEWQLEEDHGDVEIIERRIRLETNPCNRYMAQLANIVAHGNRCRAAYECRRAGNGRDVVSTGRYPYTGHLGVLRPEDKAIVEQSLRETDALDFADRPFQSISRRPQLSHSTISPLADVTRLSTADGSDILHPLHWLLISRASGGVMRFLIS